MEGSGRAIADRVQQSTPVTPTQKVRSTPKTPPSSSKKRKINSINVSLNDPSLQNPNEMAALRSSGDVFFDMKPRWRRAYMQEMTRKREGEVVLLCPDDSEKPLIELMGSSEDEEEDGSFTDPGTERHTPEVSSFVRTPTQKHDSKPTSIADSTFREVFGNDDSPCGIVEGLGCGNIYFWQRSMAWSDDEGEDRQQPSASARHSLRQVSMEKKPRNRITVPQRFQKKRDNEVTQIHWEEKILDLQRLAELKL